MIKSKRINEIKDRDILSNLTYVVDVFIFNKFMGSACKFFSWMDDDPNIKAFEITGCYRVIPKHNEKFVYSFYQLENHSQENGKPSFSVASFWRSARISCCRESNTCRKSRG